MEKFEMSEIEDMKSDFDEFVIEAEDFIRGQKGYGNQDKV